MPGRNTPNCQNKILIEMVGKIIPSSWKNWMKVAKKYQRETGEKDPRHSLDV
jgi:hypothetical protein